MDVNFLLIKLLCKVTVPNKLGYVRKTNLLAKNTFYKEAPLLLQSVEHDTFSMMMQHLSHNYLNNMNCRAELTKVMVMPMQQIVSRIIYIKPPYFRSERLR